MVEVTALTALVVAAGLPVGEFLGGVAPKVQLLLCRVSIEDNEPQTMIKALQHLISLRKKGSRLMLSPYRLDISLTDSSESKF